MLNALQKEILRLVILEKSNYEIALLTDNSVPNVKKNLQFLFKHYKVRTRAGLVREGVKESLLSEYFSSKK